MISFLFFSAFQFTKPVIAAIINTGINTNYPGWQYAKQSVLRDDILAAWKAVSGREGRIEATHGGLECGVFIEKIPGLDAVSAGPELHDVHSVKEQLSVPSTKLVYEMTCELLKRSK